MEHFFWNKGLKSHKYENIKALLLPTRQYRVNFGKKMTWNKSQHDADDNLNEKSAINEELDSFKTHVEQQNLGLRKRKYISSIPPQTFSLLCLGYDESVLKFCVYYFVSYFYQDCTIHNTNLFTSLREIRTVVFCFYFLFLKGNQELENQRSLSQSDEQRQHTTISWRAMSQWLVRPNSGGMRWEWQVERLKRKPWVM